MSENNYISIDEVLEKTTFGRSSLYAKIGEGLFPKPVKLGSRKIAWPEYEVNQMMAFYLRTTDEEERKSFVTNLEKIRIERSDPMNYNFRLNYVPGVDKEFQSNLGTYKQRYVDYDPLSRECKSRHRRFLEFINASGLIEEPRNPSFKHSRISQKLHEGKDHITYLWFNKVGVIPVLLTEPYTRKTLNCNGLAIFEVPENIAPYCGGPLKTQGGFICRTKSFLCVNTVHAKHLKEIGVALTNRAKKLPPWFSIS